MTQVRNAGGVCGIHNWITSGTLLDYNNQGSWVLVLESRDVDYRNWPMKDLTLFGDDATTAAEAGPGGGEGACGRDEMNLAEFPLALLTDRVPLDLQERKTLRFEYPQGTLTVSGSDAYGLPTAADADVLVGLVQLTRRANDFRDARVPFTRYELLKVLRWPDEGRYYRRLEESLNRWVGVTLYYDNTWWDNRARKHLTAKLHVLDTIVIDESQPRGRRKAGARPSSYFVWNSTFIESCQADNLKRLDLDTYFGLRSAVAKRVYRFLDKRFYRSPEWEFDLREFAIDYVGLSRSYESNAGKIKEKLADALRELEAAGFLEPAPRERRYVKKGRSWSIRVRRAPTARTHAAPSTAPSPATAPPPPPAPPGPSPSPATSAATASAAAPVVEMLTSRGVSARAAEELARTFPADRIAAKVDLLDWQESTASGRNRVNDPGAWLVRAIVDDYGPPRGFVPRADREAEARAKALAEASRRDEAAARQRRRDEQAAIEDYWRGLDPAAREALDAQALAESPPPPEVSGSPLRRAYLKMVRDIQIRRRLFGDEAPKR